jgi:hypothetical protein
MLLSYILRIVPFANATSRAIHFARHGHEFGAKSELEYERMTDKFMATPKRPNLSERVNLTGTHDRIRLEGITRHFGVAYNGVTLRTFHIRSASAIALRGGPLGFVLHKCAEVHP